MACWLQALNSNAVRLNLMNRLNCIDIIMLANSLRFEPEFTTTVEAQGSYLSVFFIQRQGLMTALVLFRAWGIHSIINALVPRQRLAVGCRAAS